jgi:hypothetical protein
MFSIDFNRIRKQIVNLMINGNADLSSKEIVEYRYEPKRRSSTDKQDRGPNDGDYEDAKEISNIHNNGQ